MIVGEYSSAEAFFPSKTIQRCGALKVTGSGYVDYDGKLVHLDDSKVCSSFVVLAKIPGEMRACRCLVLKSVVLTVCKCRRCSGQPGWGTRREPLD
jgi:hypothetical protein